MTTRASGFRSLLVLVLGSTVWAACVDSSDAGRGTPGVDGGADGSLCGVTSCVDGAVAPDAAEPGDASIADAPGDVAIDSADAAALHDVYVDPTNGLDTNVGTAALPFKTIRKASTVVPAGSTVWLADGTYNAANQGGATPLALPDGARVSAKNVGLAILDGLQVVANGASNAVAGVVFKSGAAGAATLAAAGATKVTLTQSSFTGLLPSSGVVVIGDAAELVIVGGTFDGAGGGVEGFGYQLIGATGTSKLTLDGVTMKNFQASAIGVNGGSSTTPVVVLLKNGTVLDTIGTADNCASGGSIVLTKNVSLTVDASEIKNAKTAGICVRNGTASQVHVTLQNGAKLTNDVNGIRSEPGTGSEMTLVVNGATFTSNISAGIFFDGSGSFDITASTATGNGSGISVNAGLPLAVKMRQSTSANNTFAFSANGTALTLDLGTVASPGANTFTGNTTSGLQLGIPAGQTATAVGNTWNAGLQSADAAGHYTAGTSVAGPASGGNYQLLNASTLTL